MHQESSQKLEAARPWDKFSTERQDFFTARNNSRIVSKFNLTLRHLYAK